MRRRTQNQTVTVTYEHETSDGVCTFEVTGIVSPYVPAYLSGPPENCYPAEGGEVEVIDCHLVDATFDDDREFSTLSDDQVKAIEAEFMSRYEGDLNSRIDELIAEQANDDYFDDMYDRHERD